MTPDQTLPSVTSITLLGKVRDLSDQQAWNEFVRRYTPRIFAWCKRFSLQEQDASDVTQQVLLKLVAAMQEFVYDPSQGSFRGWLKTITSNAVRDSIRKKSNQVITGDGANVWLSRLAEDAAIASLTDQIEEGYRQELLDVAESRVQLRVKPKTWEIYQHFCKMELSPKEVAEKLNVKVADVYVAKSRVVKMLRDVVLQLEQFH
ncbi:MAG: RNA polymerase sigma factor [Mariniblastus sp.]